MPSGIWQPCRSGKEGREEEEQVHTKAERFGSSSSFPAAVFTRRRAAVRKERSNIAMGDGFVIRDTSPRWRKTFSCDSNVSWSRKKRGATLHMCDGFVNRDTSPRWREHFSCSSGNSGSRRKREAILGYDFIRQEGLVVYGVTDKCYFSNIAYV